MKTKTTKKARISAKAVTTPELYSYLRRHRLCRKYLRNLKEQHPARIKDIIAGESPLKNIETSFFWRKTPEGWDFWNCQNDKQMERI